MVSMIGRHSLIPAVLCSKERPQLVADKRDHAARVVGDQRGLGVVASSRQLSGQAASQVMPFASDRDPGLGQPDTGGTTGFEPVTACPLHVPAPPHLLPSFPSCLFASYGGIVIRPHTGR